MSTQECVLTSTNIVTFASQQDLNIWSNFWHTRDQELFDDLRKDGCIRLVRGKVWNKENLIEISHQYDYSSAEVYTACQEVIQRWQKRDDFKQMVTSVNVKIEAFRSAVVAEFT